MRREPGLRQAGHWIWAVVITITPLAGLFTDTRKMRTRRTVSDTSSKPGYLIKRGEFAVSYMLNYLCQSLPMIYSIWTSPSIHENRHNCTVLAVPLDSSERLI